MWANHFSFFVTGTITGGQQICLWTEHHTWWGGQTPLRVLTIDACGQALTRSTIDSIAICISGRAICILQKILGNVDIFSKPFLFRRKYLYCIYTSIAMQYTSVAVQYRFFLLITDNNRQKPTYWACQVKHTSSQWISTVMWLLVTSYLRLSLVR